MFKSDKKEIPNPVTEKQLSSSTKKIIQNLEKTPTKAKIISDFFKHYSLFWSNCVLGTWYLFSQ